MLDEGDPVLVDATMAIVAECCATGEPAPDQLVADWLAHRNDTSALQTLTHKGFVVDTMEIAAPWSRLVELYDEVTAALKAVPSTRAATCHLSHSYADGACLYFTFAATPEPADVEATYTAFGRRASEPCWPTAATSRTTTASGINRGRFVAEALGPAFGVLTAVKTALDPAGILNPGKLGLPSPFGPAPWPEAST